MPHRLKKRETVFCRASDPNPKSRSWGITEIGRLGRETGVESQGLGAGGGNAETLNLKSEGEVGRQAVGEGISRENAKVIIFQKFRPDPGFLDCGGLTPLWIFPSTRSIPIQSSVKPEHSKTPSWPLNVIGN
jgi:hypothetical protein